MGEAAVLLGDVNATTTEPAFERLTTGLRDVHAAVRGSACCAIDVVVAGARVEPVSVEV